MQARDCSSVDYSQPGRELRFQIASTEASRCSTFSLRHSSVPGSSSAADPAAISYRKAVASACPDARLQIMAPRKLSPAPTTLTGLIGTALERREFDRGRPATPLVPPRSMPRSRPACFRPETGRPQSARYGGPQLVERRHPLDRGEDIDRGVHRKGDYVRHSLSVKHKR